MVSNIGGDLSHNLLHDDFSLHTVDVSFDPDWIIILFVIYLDAFIVKKCKESTCRVILVAGPSLENWGSKRCFLGFWCLNLVPTPLMVFYTQRPFQRCRPCVNRSSYAKVMPPVS
jgi:hypothetical protein